MINTDDLHRMSERFSCETHHVNGVADAAYKSAQEYAYELGLARGRMEALAEPGHASYAEWWSQQALNSDPTKNPFLARDAFYAGRVNSFAANNELMRKLQNYEKYHAEVLQFADKLKKCEPGKPTGNPKTA